MNRPVFMLASYLQMGMGKTIQAISVLVTHRDDEMTFVFDGSEEAKAAAEVKAVKDAAAAAVAASRPRISLSRPPQSGGSSIGVGLHRDPTAACKPIEQEASGSRSAGPPAGIASSGPSVFDAFAAGAGASSLSNAAGRKRGSSSGGSKKGAVKAGASSAEGKEGGDLSKDDLPSAPAAALSAPAPAPAPSAAAGPWPHVKPGKNVAPGTMCQECLRDQAPQAHVQVRVNECGKVRSRSETSLVPCTTCHRVNAPFLRPRW